MAIPSFDPSIKVQKAVRVLGLDWLGLHSLPLPSLRDIVTIPGKCSYLIGEKWRQTQKGHQQKKNVEKAESKGCEDEKSTSCQHAKQAESIDGARSGDSSKPVGDTSQNDIEKKQPDVKTPKTYRKIGQQRQVLKKGTWKHCSKKGKNHVGLKVILIILFGKPWCAMASSVPSTEITPTTEPRMMDTLPTACTDTGSKRNDTWLDKKDVISTTISGVFDGSNRGYTNICPNAFDGLSLRDIILTGNNITELPDGLFRNVRDGLHRVHLDHNHLTSYPVALNEYPDIEFIDISYNEIKEIPKGTISTATNLHGLDASGNVNLGQYPEDLFYLSNLRIVYFRNTAISILPFPPLPSSGVYETFHLKCEGDIVTLVRESGKLQFDMKYTDALSPENCFALNGSNATTPQTDFNASTTTPSPMTTLHNYTLNSSNATKPQTDFNASTTTPSPMTTLHNYTLNSSNATKPQTDFNARTTTPSPMTLHDSALNANISGNSNATQPQNDFNAGVLLVVISVVIFVICIYRLCLIAKGSGKDGSPRLEIVRLFVVAVVMIIVTFFVAWLFFGIWEALILAGVAVVAVMAVFVYSYKAKKNERNNMPSVMYQVAPQQVSI